MSMARRIAGALLLTVLAVPLGALAGVLCVAALWVDLALMMAENCRRVDATARND